MLRRTALAVLCLLLICGSGKAQEIEDALARSREAAENHRYAEVIELMTPFNSAADSEDRYIAAAEIGRAYFHLGQYLPAHRAFETAVRLHPDRVETALYLEATSYLLGDTEQALAIFEEVLRSGGHDLYLAVTLPGERQFLSDPGVLALLEEYAQPLEVDLENGSLLGVKLGEDRAQVAQALSSRSSDPSKQALTASAGPVLIWAFTFDPEQRLDEVVVVAEALYRYTPYRLQLSNGLDWRATPATAVAKLGPPERTETGKETSLTMTWNLPGLVLTLEFGQPLPPRPPWSPEGTATLRSLRLQRTDSKTSSDDPGRMDE